MTSVEENLAKLGISLPEAAAPVANYVAYCISGNLISISGQIPMKDGEVLYKGKVGREYTVEEGREAATICAINLIAQMKAALDGDLGRVTRIVKLGGFVNGVEDFTDHPVVINAASDLMVAAFGDRGRHSRSAVGSGSLPLGVAVEIDALVEFA